MLCALGICLIYVTRNAKIIPKGTRGEIPTPPPIHAIHDIKKLSQNPALSGGKISCKTIAIEVV